jgi:enamine deaminase RidA (YjgF/YER057c/UK114 family)
MDSLDCRDGFAASSFRRPGSGEHFIMVEPPADLPLGEQVAFVQRRYAQARHDLDLAPGSAVFRRVFVSDIMNQAGMLREARFDMDTDGSPVALSLVQQPPLSRAKIALLAYHVDGVDAGVKTRISPHDVLVMRHGLGHLWTTGLCAAAGERPNAARQTREVFGALIGTLGELGGTLRENCMRTWLFMKDVDLFYEDMVSSRRDLFTLQGLTTQTHFIASTGIEGACAHRHDLVSMDAYSVIGLRPEQVSYLNDFDHLCATADYNVTFERGTRIDYADRAHLLISGTASIDHAGRVVHPGDVLRQLDRALANVAALLRDGEAAPGALMYLIVYLRDPGDYPAVREAVAASLPGVPSVIVLGPVCRPEWLIEVEGIAITGNEAPALPAF